MNNVFHFEVPAATKKIRADAFCITILHGITRSRLKAGLQELKINGKKAKLSTPVHSGDYIDLKWQNPIPTTLIPEPIPISIIFENTDVLIANKPAGMVTHPAAGNWTGTLANALDYYRRYGSSITDEFSHTEAIETSKSDQNTTAIEHLRTGIVHRLDKDTSGVIITARNRNAELFLKNAFKQRQVDKYYLAILHGIPPQAKGTVVTSIFRSSGDKTRFSASADISKGKYARSKYKVLRTYGNYTLVLFRIYTGRTHQIRLHARFIGCPVAGDTIYGRRTGKAAKMYEKQTAKKKQPCLGLLLHAYKVGIRLPHQAPDEPKSIFTAGIPGRFKKAIQLLKENPCAML